MSQQVEQQRSNRVAGKGRHTFYSEGIPYVVNHHPLGIGIHFCAIDFTSPCTGDYQCNVCLDGRSRKTPLSRKGGKGIEDGI